MASMMLRMIGLGPKKAKKKKNRRATLGAVPEYQKEQRKPPTKDGRTPLGAIQEHREVPKARKVRRSMRRHSLGAMPLSPDEKTPPRKRSPVKKQAPPKWEQFAREKGISPRPKMSPPPPGTPAEVRRLRKRVSELEQTIAFRDKSLDDIEAELLAAYASLLAAADLGFETSKYEARVEELSTAATEHPERALRDQELRRAFVDEEVSGPASEALALIRGLVPSDLSSGGSVSVERLVDAGLPVKVAHRVSRTRALWLTRVHPDEIAKMHASDLVNTRATVTLDLVEARAVWRQCLRVNFAENDTDGRKRAWFEELERRVRTLVSKEAEGDLSPKDACHPAYDKFRRESGPFSDVTSPEKGFAPTKSGAYLPTPQPYSAKRTVVRTPAPSEEFPPFSETAQATPMCPQQPHEEAEDFPATLESPEVIKAAVEEADVENRRRSSVGSAATMAFVEATLREDDAMAPPPPPSDTTDNSAASSRKSVTWRLPEKPANDWFDAAARKAAQARSVPRTRIAPPPSIDVEFADDALRQFVETNGLSAYAAAILGVADSLDDLVEATDEDVDELAAETGMPKLKQRKFKRALAGLRGDSA
ncbi:unnamed protein product [Pelagomonas calceolata]|uniref:SAM domain-containing protein n=1 Tax=Pelagomonas calceolata TaxID=35677 RepID=A0A8J2SK28_9STRA|nr:unnamed protein product [Pelagomonas calceolata]